MNYKNGREAKSGDAVIGIGNNIKGLIVGHIVALIEEQKSPGVGAPPIKAAVKILTHLKSPDHKNASTATFNTVQEFGVSENFVHAEDALSAITPVAIITLGGGEKAV